MTGNRLLYTTVLCLSLCFTSCERECNGHVKFKFLFNVDGETLQQDTCKYRNAAGNIYLVTEAQYFISDVRLTGADGKQVKIGSDGGAHYVDADIASTMTWLPTDEIPAGVYTSLSFVFGLAPERDYHYADPPENNMSWPASLGGGYHYMKINGKWQRDDGTLSPFNLHLGVGRHLDADGNTIDLIDNTFTVSIGLTDFEIGSDKTVEDITLAMNVNNWFVNPHLFDFNVYGGSIMQNQEAQEILMANGAADVFSIR